MSLLSLVAYGAQDMYLAGDPNITFFNVVYRRHTNFCVEATKVRIVLSCFVCSNDNAPNDRCSICLDDFEIGNRIHETDCNHYFHHDCLHSYVKKSCFACPMCRTINHIECD